MKDRQFKSIVEPKNNFKKIEDVKSELLWKSGDENINPLISVVVITNRRLEMLKEAVQSICQQECVSYPWELIIMDNNPEEEQVIEFIKTIEGCNLRYYRNEKNIEHEGNVNRGIELAKGKWVALLHDDDLLVPNYLCLVKQYIDVWDSWDKPLAYMRARHECFSDIKEVKTHKGKEKIESTFFIKGEKWIETLVRGVGPTYVNSCGSLVNRQAFLEIGGYNDEINPIGDSTLGLIFMNKGYSVYASERVLGFYRQGKNISAKKKTVLDLIEADFLLREYLYSRNKWTQLFGKCFRDVQYVECVNQKIRTLKKYLGQDSNEIPMSEEINHIHLYKRKPVREKVFFIVKVLTAIIFRPAHLIRRWL